MLTWVVRKFSTKESTLLGIDVGILPIMFVTGTGIMFFSGQLPVNMMSLKWS